ncbi:hypothetical protein [Legionella maioricensis]|uniref:DUF4153 domain-containing protein n=1 Tax=Legionella maioricensis TaxID=2896528 RepID=A0A9X2D1Y9_9GAMM|nr:hypothetical protein [Legionella maioricensis]MCL9684723.1 hypothetical protein [Legionella maioricensis]MCL9687751.1 hypothetical protein [Legionella maioricensis]
MAFKKSICLFALIGLLLGFIIDFWARYQNVALFYPTLVSIFSYLYVLAYDEKNVFRLIGTSFIAALFLSLPLLGLNFNSPTFNDVHFISFIIAFPLFVYIGHCFHYAYHHDNTWDIDYSTLFAAVWNTILLLFVASVFAFLGHMLIMLAAFIFKTVGNSYLWDLFWINPHFRFIMSVTLFFIGLGVGQQNIEIIYNMRFLLLKMMYYLFPFLAVISTLYFILYLGHLFSTEKESINPLTVLLPLSILGIIFFNAYFQDGTTYKDTPIWLKTSLRVYRGVLFILILMMSYRIGHEASLDINVLIYLFMVILLGFTYAITALVSEPMEQKWIRIGNVCTALFFIIALFLVNLPYAPVKFSIGSDKPSVTQLPSTVGASQEPTSP